MKKSVMDSMSSSIINKYTLITSASGAIPIPILDMGATTALQISMLKELCTLYEVSFDEQVSKGLLASLLSNAGKRAGTSMLKTIPVIGTVIGGFTNSLLSGVSTYALGHAFIKYVTVKGPIDNLKDMDLGAFSKFYKEFIRKASLFTKGEKDSKKTSYQEKMDRFKEFGCSKLGSKENFNKWLNTPSEFLEGRKPIEEILASSTEDEAVIDRLIKIISLQ